MNWERDSDRRLRNTAAVLIFGGLFSFVGTLLFLLLIALPAWQMMATLKWQPTDCTITHAEVATNGNMHSTDLRYLYVFEGKDYEGQRHSLNRMRTSNRASWQTLIDSYPVGSEQTCYVNPQRPDHAVLTRLTLGYSALVPVPFLAIGLGVLYGVKIGKIKIGLRGKPSEWRPMALIKNHKPGPIVLSPRRARVITFLKMGLATFVWNGIVVMVIEQSLPRGIMDVIQTIAVLVISSFAIVGIVLMYRTIRWLIIIFSPAVKLELELHPIYLGSTTPLKWRPPGKPGQVTNLVIRVVAEEHIFLPEDSHGTDHHGNRTTKKSAMLYEQGLAIERNGALLSIPADAMHSFEAEHSQVNWHLVVSAEVAGWPDIRDRFPLTVLPAPVQTGQK